MKLTHEELLANLAFNAFNGINLRLCILAREEGMFPSLYPSLRKALTPLLDPAALDLLAAVKKAVETQSEGNRRALRQRGGPSLAIADAAEKKADAGRAWQKMLKMPFNAF